MGTATIHTCERCGTETLAIEFVRGDFLCPTCSYAQESLEGRTVDFSHYVTWEPVSLAEMQRTEGQEALEKYV